MKCVNRMVFGLITVLCVFSLTGCSEIPASFLMEDACFAKNKGVCQWSKATTGTSGWMCEGETLQSSDIFPTDEGDFWQEKEKGSAAPMTQALCAQHSGFWIPVAAQGKSTQNPLPVKP